MSQTQLPNEEMHAQKKEDEASQLWKKYHSKDANKEIALKAWVVVGIIAVVVLMFIGLWIVAFQ